MANASYESQFYENAARAEISRSIVSKKNSKCLASHCCTTGSDSEDSFSNHRGFSSCFLDVQF